MFYRRLALFFFLTILSVKSFSAVFVVTSNADSGPGTLRDALTLAAANGSATTDYINFNLAGASLAQRTITLLSQLPFVSSNLVIDGTTQPGANLNLGDAKINITVDIYSYIIPLYSTGALIIDGANDVEVYGLSINRFYYLQNNFPGSGSIINSGILITNSLRVTIGAPNKGNYFENNDYSIYAGSTDYSKDDSPISLKVQSNYFGFESSQISYVPSGVAIFGHDVLFGGDTPLEGNHLVGVCSIDGTNIRITHNYFGLDGNGNPVGYYPPRINCGSVYTDGVIISNNLSSFLSIQLQYTKNFNIYANIDIANKTPLLAGIFMNSCNNGIIGSNDITLQNIFNGNNNSLQIVNEYSNNIQILKNSISCSAGAYNTTVQAPIIIPDIKVLVNDNSEYSGTATPNSDIYIYIDNTNCPICNPVVFYTTVTADVNGIWKITGNFKDKKLISNALLNQNSSEFTDAQIPDTYKNGIITLPSCGKNNGSLAINETKNVLNIEWYDSNDIKIGSGPTIQNLGPGYYYAKGFNGGCSIKSPVYFLYNVQPLIIDDNVKILNPSCGVGGSIKGLITTTLSQNPATFSWTDQNNNVVGAEPDIDNLSAGAYLLTMTDNITMCSVTYGPINIKNTVGPNIDQTNATIQSSNCGQSTGSITNITATGTGALQYSWMNSQQQQVGTSVDLMNQPTGSYTLQVIDNTQCGPVYSTAFTIPEINGITMDETKAQTSIASCGINNGSVTGIRAPGATQFQWTDANNKVVSTTVDLINAAPGDYLLNASNNSGCSKTSASYHVGQTIPTQFPAYSSTIVDACFSTNNGSVSISTDATVKAERWVDSQGNTIGNNALLNNISAGTYKLYLTDQNGCENYYNSYSINELPLLRIMNGGQTSDDMCGLKTGSIGSVNATGGLPPYIYKWTDVNGTQISIANGLSNLAAGSYTLNISDSKCGSVSFTYQLNEGEQNIIAPSVSDIQLCSSGDAMLTVNNSSAAATYLLYDTQGALAPLDVKKGGRFKVNITKDRSYYISQVNGTCESPRSEMKVIIGLSALTIPNAITPNGDNINDYWHISGIENYPAAIIKVYDRYGQIVFQSRGYAKPFEGKLNNKYLPGGAYYYVINLGTNCSLLSGSLTIIR